MRPRIEGELLTLAKNASEAGAYDSVGEFIRHAVRRQASVELDNRDAE